RRRRLDGLDQFLDGHRGEEVVAVEALYFAGLAMAGANRHHTPRVDLLDAIDYPARQDLAALGLHFTGDLLPHLPGPELPIHESIDERRFDGFLGQAGFALRQKAADHVRQSLGDRKALDALRAPLGADFLAGHT